MRDAIDKLQVLALTKPVVADYALQWLDTFLKTHTE